MNRQVETNSNFLPSHVLLLESPFFFLIVALCLLEGWEHSPTPIWGRSPFSVLLYQTSYQIELATQLLVYLPNGLRVLC